MKNKASLELGGVVLIAISLSLANSPDSVALRSIVEQLFIHDLPVH